MRIVFVFLALIWGSCAMAAPQVYVLDKAGSDVVFTWFLGKDAVRGDMPITRADLKLDFDRAAASTIDVVLDASQAKAGFAFATNAMRGPSILDAQSHPEIRFRSTKVIGQGAGAVVIGDLTIRGVTRSTRFDVTLYRGEGSLDLSQIAVLLKGSVVRSDFGATGWPDMVGNTIEINILARVSRVD